MTKRHFIAGITQLCFGQPQIPPLLPMTLNVVTNNILTHCSFITKTLLRLPLNSESLQLEMRKYSNILLPQNRISKKEALSFKVVLISAKDKDSQKVIRFQVVLQELLDTSYLLLKEQECGIVPLQG